MKNKVSLYCFIAFLVLLASVAAGIAWTGLATKSVDLITMTKSYKYSVKGKQAIAFYPSATVSVYLNGTGNYYPYAATTNHELGVFRNISTVKFTCVSTAAVSPVTIRVQVQ